MARARRKKRPQRVGRSARADAARASALARPCDVTSPARTLSAVTGMLAAPDPAAGRFPRRWASRAPSWGALVRRMMGHGSLIAILPGVNPIVVGDGSATDAVTTRVRDARAVLRTAVKPDRRIDRSMAGNFLKGRMAIEHFILSNRGSLKRWQPGLGQHELRRTWMRPRSALMAPAHCVVVLGAGVPFRT